MAALVRPRALPPRFDYEIVSCSSKLRYESRSKAESALKGMISHRLRGRGSQLVPYRCKCCDGYHLGNKPVKEKMRS